jgi:protein PhnA
MAKNKDWLNDDKETNLVVKDSNGTILQEGDAVMAIKDLKVKWAPDIKRGDKFKNIKLTDDPELIESGKMVLRTKFFKKV